MPANEEIFELAEESAKPAPKPRLVRLPSVFPAPPKPDTLDLDKLKNFQMPLWLLAGGLAIELGRAFFVEDRAFFITIGGIIIGTAISVAVMLASVLVAVKFRGISLGALPTAIFKLAAISVAPDAVAMMIAPAGQWIPGAGFIFAPLAAFIFRFALLGALFDLEESDTWYVIMVMFIVGVAMYFVEKSLHIG
jgi:hypothetical protein